MSASSDNADRPHYRCPRCGAISYHAMDIRERYCVRCHLFEDDPDGTRELRQ